MTVNVGDLIKYSTAINPKNNWGVVNAIFSLNEKISSYSDSLKVGDKMYKVKSISFNSNCMLEEIYERDISEVYVRTQIREEDR